MSTFQVWQRGYLALSVNNVLVFHGRGPDGRPPRDPRVADLSRLAAEFADAAGGPASVSNIRSGAFWLCFLSSSFDSQLARSEIGLIWPYE